MSHPATPLYTTALHFVCARTEAWPQAARLAAIRDPQVEAAQAAIFAAGLDETTIKQRCNAWVKTLMRHAPAKEPTP